MNRWRKERKLETKRERKMRVKGLVNALGELAMRMEMRERTGYSACGRREEAFRRLSGRATVRIGSWEWRKVGLEQSGVWNAQQRREREGV